MPAREPLRLLLDADMSSHALRDLLSAAGHDVVAAGLLGDLGQLDDRILFSFAQAERRITITHNVRHFPSILVECAVAGRPHHGCILSHLPTHAFAEMKRRFEQWFEQFPAQDDWLDRAVHL